MHSSSAQARSRTQWRRIEVERTGVILHRTCGAEPQQDCSCRRSELIFAGTEYAQSHALAKFFYRASFLSRLQKGWSQIFGLSSQSELTPS